MPDWVPKPDADAATYFNTVITAIEADEAGFGTTSTVSGALRTKLTAYTTALSASDAAKATASNAVSTKDAARATLEGQLRPLVQQIQANPAVTDAMRT